MERLFPAHGGELAPAWTDAAAAATTAAEATADLVPQVGRARTHGQKSVGPPDPGAISFARAMTAVAAVIGQRETYEQKEN